MQKTFEFKSNNGEPVLFHVDASEEFFDKLYVFSANGNYAKPRPNSLKGDMFCFWQLDSPLKHISQFISQRFDEINEYCRSLGLPPLDSEEAIKRQIEETVTDGEFLFEDCAYLYFSQTQLELIYSIYLILVRCAFQSVTQVEEFTRFSKREEREQREKLRRQFDLINNKRLGVERGGANRRKANLRKLYLHYDVVISEWREATGIYVETQKSLSSTRRANWRDDIARVFPSLPADLLERLQPIKDWPEDIAQKCSKLGGENKPEDIALEDAARLCGATDYAYKLSSLRETYRKQKREQKQNKN